MAGGDQQELGVNREVDILGPRELAEHTGAVGITGLINLAAQAAHLASTASPEGRPRTSNTRADYDIPDFLAETCTGVRRISFDATDTVRIQTTCMTSFML